MRRTDEGVVNTNFRGCLPGPWKNRTDPIHTLSATTTSILASSRRISCIRRGSRRRLPHVGDSATANRHPRLQEWAYAVIRRCGPYLSWHNTEPPLRHASMRVTSCAETQQQTALRNFVKDMTSDNAAGGTSRWPPTGQVAHISLPGHLRKPVRPAEQLPLMRTQNLQDIAPPPRAGIRLPLYAPYPARLPNAGTADDRFDITTTGRAN